MEAWALGVVKGLYSGLLRNKPNSSKRNGCAIKLPRNDFCKDPRQDCGGA